MPAGGFRESAKGSEKQLKGSEGEFEGSRAIRAPSGELERRPLPRRGAFRARQLATFLPFDSLPAIISIPPHFTACFFRLGSRFDARAPVLPVDGLGYIDN